MSEHVHEHYIHIGASTFSSCDKLKDTVDTHFVAPTISIPENDEVLTSWVKPHYNTTEAKCFKSVKRIDVTNKSISMTGFLAV